MRNNSPSEHLLRQGVKRTLFGHDKKIQQATCYYMHTYSWATGLFSLRLPIPITVNNHWERRGNVPLQPQPQQNTRTRKQNPPLDSDPLRTERPLPSGHNINPHLRPLPTGVTSIDDERVVTYVETVSIEKRRRTVAVSDRSTKRSKRGHVLYLQHDKRKTFNPCMTAKLQSQKEHFTRTRSIDQHDTNTAKKTKQSKAVKKNKKKNTYLLAVISEPHSSCRYKHTSPTTHAPETDVQTAPNRNHGHY